MTTVLVIFNTMNAECITETEALAVARRFMPDMTFSQYNTDGNTSRTMKRDADYLFYIFNADDNGGFVIVDSNTSDVIGYSYEGNIDYNNMPENARLLLGGYGRTQEKELSDNMGAYRNIAPLINTKWGQWAPFNGLCPHTEDYEVPTGCVATAISQLLYYHRPDTAMGIPAYNELDSLPPTSFDWDTMQLEYEGTETGASAESVAKLMRYCGQAMKMNYAAGGSWQAIAVNDSVFSKVFGMSKSDAYLFRTFYDTKTWEELIYNELVASRPVLYSGSSSSDRHAFIIDGYEHKDGKSFFHMNFGWQGDADGYYALSSADGFCIDHSAIVGVKLDEGEDETLRLKIWDKYISFKDSIYYRATKSDPFDNIKVKGIYGSIYFTNPTEVSVGWGLFDGIDLLDTLFTNTECINSDYFHGYNQYNEFSIASDIKNGTYSIRQIWHAVGDTVWHLMGKANSHYIKAIIEDSTLTLQLSAPGTYRLRMDSISYSSPKLRRNKKVIIAADITNLSDRGSGVPVYLFEEGNPRAIMVSGLYAEQGQSDMVYFNYTPKTAGAKLLNFSTDNLGEDVFFTDSIFVENGLDKELTYTFDIKGLDYNSLFHDSLIATIRIENPWDDVYDDGIKIRLSWGDNYAQCIDSVIPINLNKNELFESQIKLPLVMDEWYLFEIMQYLFHDNFWSWHTLKSYFFDCKGNVTSISDSSHPGESLFPADIYSINGTLLYRNAQSPQDLPKGIHLIKGKLYFYTR